MTRGLPRAPLAEVEAQVIDGRHRLKFVRSFNSPIALVFAAMTQAQQVSRWAPFRPNRDLDSVGPVVLTMLDDEKENDLAGEVIAVEPPTLVEYTWDTDILRWEFSESPHGTTVTLYHTCENPKWITMVAGGWHLCLEVLDTILAGNPYPRIVGKDAMDFGWSELRQQYADILGYRIED